MRKSRFTEEQIIGLLKQAEAGRPVAELCRQVGITDTTFSKWRNKFAGLEVSEARRLRQLEEENRRLKGLAANGGHVSWLSSTAGRYGASRRQTAMTFCAGDCGNWPRSADGSGVRGSMCCCAARAWW